MAETQRVSPSRPPRTDYTGPRRLPADATQDLRPQSPSDPPAVPERTPLRASIQPLTPSEKRLRGVLLLGLISTAAVLLVKGPALPRADVLLGSTVLFAGLSLLVVITLCRR